MTPERIKELRNHIIEVAMADDDAAALNACLDEIERLQALVAGIEAAPDQPGNEDWRKNYLAKQLVEARKQVADADKFWSERMKRADEQLKASAKQLADLTRERELHQAAYRAVIEHATGIDQDPAEWKSIAEIWHAIDQHEVNFAHEYAEGITRERDEEWCKFTFGTKGCALRAGHTCGHTSMSGSMWPRELDYVLEPADIESTQRGGDEG